MSILNELITTGISRLPRMEGIDEFVAHLAACPKYPGHVKARPRDGISCHAMVDVMAAPHFLDWARSLTSIVEDYFDGPAVLWSLNAFYTDQNTPYVRSLHGLHKDREADKIMVLFVLGHDTHASGAQLFVPRDNNRRWEAVCGPKGTAWLADTTHWHCGLLPTEPRLIAWARWSDKLPKAYFEEGLPPV